MKSYEEQMFKFCCKLKLDNNGAAVNQSTKVEQKKFYNLKGSQTFLERSLFF